MYLNMIKKCASAVIFIFALTLVPALASAEPLGFKRPRSTFSLGFDVFDAMLGDFGNASDVGMSVFADATIQFGGYFGAHVRFGSARAFTDKDFLPFDNGYQFIYMTVAPRFFFSPFRKLTLYFFAQPEISLQVLVSNTLVKLTGNNNMTGAAGGSVGLQFLLGIISVTAQVSCQYNWNIQSIFLGGSFSVGLSNTI